MEGESVLPEVHRVFRDSEIGTEIIRYLGTRTIAAVLEKTLWLQRCHWKCYDLEVI